MSFCAFGDENEEVCRVQFIWTLTTTKDECRGTKDCQLRPENEVITAKLSLMDLGFSSHTNNNKKYLKCIKKCFCYANKAINDLCVLENLKIFTILHFETIPVHGKK